MKVITIGRSKEHNDIVVDDVKVSRNHLQMVMDDQGNYSVLDLNSTNGTFVNGQRITGEVPLKVTDELRIGDTVLSWQCYFGSQPNSGEVNPVPPQTPTPQPPMSPQPPTPPQSPVSDPSPKRWMIYAIIGAAVLLLAVGGGIGWKVYRDKQQNIELEEKQKAEEEAKNKQKALDEAKDAAHKADIEYEEAMRKAAEAQTEAERLEKIAAQSNSEKNRRAAETARADAVRAKQDADKAKKDKESANTTVKNLETQLDDLKGKLHQANEKINEVEAEKEKMKENTLLTNKMQTILNGWDDSKASAFCKKKGWPTKNARTVINDHFTNLSDNAKKQKMIDEMNGFKVNPKQAEQQTPTSSKATIQNTPPAQSASTESQPDTNKPEE